jgi:two-component sensor histidine kinase
MKHAVILAHRSRGSLNATIGDAGPGGEPVDTVRVETPALPPSTAPGRHGFDLALPFLQTLAAGFAGSRHRIHVACDPALRLPAAELAPMGTIVSEAISNALKHAFADGRQGDIWLRLSEDRHRMTLAIRDNGVGMPDLDQAADSGRGRIEGLARQLGGYARLGSANFGGAEVLVVFPCNA